MSRMVWPARQPRPARPPAARLPAAVRPPPPAAADARGRIERLDISAESTLRAIPVLIHTFLSSRIFMSDVSLVSAVSVITPSVSRR